MSTYDKLAFDLRGRRVYNGTTVRERTWFPLEDTALPAWLTSTGDGATTVQAAGDGGGGVGQVKLTTAATINSVVRVSTPLINVPDIYEIGFYMDGVWTGSTDPTTFAFKFGIYNAATTKGAYYGQNGNPPGAMTVVGGATTGLPDTAFLASGDSTGGRHSMGVIFRPKEALVYLVRDRGDGFVATQAIPTAGNANLTGQVAGVFEVTALTAAVQNMFFQQATLRIVSA